MKVQAPASIDVMMLLHCALYLPELVIWGYLLYNCSRQAIGQGFASVQKPPLKILL